MGDVPLPEPYGRVTMHTVSGLEFFYRHPEPPYLDTAKSCTIVYTWEALHAHAAAVTAAARRAAVRWHCTSKAVGSFNFEPLGRPFNSF